MSTLNYKRIIYLKYTFIIIILFYLHPVLKPAQVPPLGS